MKFKVTLKDPDGPYMCVRDALNDFYNSLPASMSDEERQEAADARYEEMQEVMHEWLSSGEYLTVEFDTVSKSCEIVK